MDDTWAAEIGQRIELARKRANFSRPELADVLGVHINTITGYERGDRHAYKSVRQIAEATDSDLRWLLHGHPYEDPLLRIEGKLDDLIAAIAPTRPEGADGRKPIPGPPDGLLHRDADRETTDGKPGQQDSPEEHDDQRRTAA